MRLTYEYLGEVVSIELERLANGDYRAQIGERVYQFSASTLAASGWLIALNQHPSVVHSVAQGDQRHVHYDGAHYTLSLVDDRARRKRKQASGGDLTAQMPGQVVAVRVQEGDPVIAGQVLVILEAMKMEIRITAPQTGTVRHLYVQQGDVVARGQQLIEVLPDESA